MPASPLINPVVIAVLSAVGGGVLMEGFKRFLAKQDRKKDDNTTYNVRILDTSEHLITQMQGMLEAQSKRLDEYSAQLQKVNNEMLQIKWEYNEERTRTQEERSRLQRRLDTSEEQNRLLAGRYDTLARFVQQIAPFADQIGVIPPPIDLYANRITVQTDHLILPADGTINVMPPKAQDDAPEGESL